MATLFVIAGPANGQRFALGQNRLVMVGRDSSCTFQIIDPKMSRMHLQVKHVPEDNRHYAIDFKSHNGVFVNDNKILQDMPLNDGDTITIGGTAILYSTDDAEDALGKYDLLRKFGEGSCRTMTSD